MNYLLLFIFFLSFFVVVVVIIIIIHFCKVLIMRKRLNKIKELIAEVTVIIYW